jgi:uroporphyrinogen decarboxylase
VRETLKPVLDVLNGKVPQRTPLWIMRQAGRYLPEYKKLRAEAGSFLNLCLTPHYASEVTLQPIRRFGFDAAILFADILLIPYALGRKLEFREGEGPVLEPVSSEKDIGALRYETEKLMPVSETIVRVKKELSPETALIGFCGGLWTVACYIIGGTSRDGFGEAKNWAREKPEKLEKLIGVLLDASITYLSAQIVAGAEVIQVFDSWAGLLKGEDFARWVIEPTRKLVTALKAKHPHIPVIGFPREAGKGYKDYIRQTGVDALSIDQHVDLGYAKKELQSLKPLQGNLDPALLVAGGAAMRNGTEKILTALGPRHIFNLGHGITPDTPPEHVAELVKIVREFWK